MTGIKKDKELLNIRDIYGDYKKIAYTSQKLKNVFYFTCISEHDEYEKEAIDMILHKIARIAHSRKKYIDNWRDIIGYAKLVIDEYEKNPNAIDSETIYNKMSEIRKDFTCSAK